MNTKRILLAAAALVILAAILGLGTNALRPIDIIGPAPAQFQSNL